MTTRSNNPFINALEQNQCPICAVLSEYEFQLILKYPLKLSENEHEIFHDYFCNFHFYELFKISNKCSLSLFFIRYLRKNMPTPDLIKSSQKASQCVFCRNIQRHSQALLRQFVHYYGRDRDFKVKFIHQSFLCMHHLKRVVASLSRAAAKEELILHQQKVMRDYLPQLEQLSQKNYFQAEDNEKKAPNEVMRLLAGYRGMNS